MLITDKSFKRHTTGCIDTEAVEKLIEIITKLSGDPAGGRKGGCLAVYDTHSPAMVVRPFGQIPKGKFAGYFRYASEKVTRLIYTGDHRSFASRDELKERFGGGIHCGG